MSDKPTTVNQYIAGFEDDRRDILESIRRAIKAEIPDASEKISYGIPTFYLNGNLLHYAAFDKDIGLYATPQGHAEFADDLSGYKQGKGSVQFPLDEPMPMDLIRRIARFRAEEHRLKKPKKK